MHKASDKVAEPKHRRYRIKPATAVLFFVRCALSSAIAVFCCPHRALQRVGGRQQVRKVADSACHMTLEPGDEVVFAEQPQPGDQVLLISDRGFAKRVLYMDFEPQARGGKGVKTFYFNRSGSNGATVAGALLLGEANASVLLTQKKSAPNLLNTGEVILQGKQDKGMPYVMSVLDDVIIGAYVIPAPAVAAADAGDDSTEN